jgi:hypothetical protein
MSVIPATQEVKIRRNMFLQPGQNISETPISTKKLNAIPYTC